MEHDARPPSPCKPHPGDFLEAVWVLRVWAGRFGVSGT